MWLEWYIHVITFSDDNRCSNTQISEIKKCSRAKITKLGLFLVLRIIKKNHLCNLIKLKKKTISLKPFPYCILGILGQCIWFFLITKGRNIIKYNDLSLDFYIANSNQHHLPLINIVTSLKLIQSFHFLYMIGFSTANREKVYKNCI